MKKDEKVFNERYAKLNKRQREAVDAIEGPVMVLAGPGTGKTEILTLRIANILRLTDAAPEQILALTFTEAGAETMRGRLSKIIGVAGYRVPIFTFHGFCNEVINRFPEHFPEIIGSRPAAELDRITVMQKVIDGSKLERLASFRSPYHYVSSALKAISLLKREAIGPSELRARLETEERAILSAPDYRHEKGAHKGKVKGVYLLRESALEKNRELARLYEGYEKGLAGEKLFDFDDMIVNVVRGLERSEELRLILQEEYQYLLADEHQDANGAQNKVLELLSSFHQSPNLFIVGDDKQAIYRFQGASLENFLYFKKKFPEAGVIPLEENYRSTQTVLDAAHRLLSTENIRLKSRAGHLEKPIAIRQYPTAEDEAEAVAEDAARKIKNGGRPEEIAIFTRTNKELLIYSSALIRAGLPVSVETEEDVENDPDIEKLLILIKAAAKVGEDEPLVRALHLDCFKVAELDIFMLAREAARTRSSIWSLAKKSEIGRVAGLIAGWGKLGWNVSPAELVSTIARQSGLLSLMLGKPDAEDKMRKFGVLLSYLEKHLITHRGARINELAEMLELLDEYNVLEVKTGGGASPKIKLSTAHRAKGLEFDHVYIVGATEGNWSGRRSHTDFKLPGIMATTKEDEERDDRRLFYVALTRARKDLTISFPATREGGKAVLPTRFLEELPPELLKREASVEAAPAGKLAGRFSPAVSPAKSPEEIRNFVCETLAERGLAVTHLNNYLECPWQYFYRSLLRVPEPQSNSLRLGNAVHHALKRFFDMWAESRKADRQLLITLFKQEADRESFTDKELTEVKEKGEKFLGGYYDFWHAKWGRNIKNELAVDTLFSAGDFPIRLTGKLDKLEFIKDNNVSVIDYKTGKPKPRSFANHKRQLVFYKLLLDAYDKGQYSMQTGVIDFVEPDEKGRYHREEFVITESEVAELRETIIRVVGELQSLSFWDKRCGEKKCEYCQIRDMQ